MDTKQKQRILREVKDTIVAARQKIQSIETDIKGWKQRQLIIQQNLKTYEGKAQEAERLLESQKRLVTAYAQKPNAKPHKIKAGRESIIHYQRIVEDANQNWRQWRAQQLEGAKFMAVMGPRVQNFRAQLAQDEAEVARRTRELAQEQKEAEMARAQEAQQRAQTEAVRRQMKSQQKTTDKRSWGEQERTPQQKQQRARPQTAPVPRTLDKRQQQGPNNAPMQQMPVNNQMSVQTYQGQERTQQQKQQQTRPQPAPVPRTPDKRQQQRLNNAPVRQMPVNNQMSVQTYQGQLIQAQRPPTQPPMPNANQSNPPNRKPLPPNQNWTSPAQMKKQPVPPSSPNRRETGPMQQPPPSGNKKQQAVMAPAQGLNKGERNMTPSTTQPAGKTPASGRSRLFKR